jgi:DNA invertase Pin-like site-specific DNA recombinase
MALYGYARVSSADQDYSVQEQALRQAGCDVIRAEKTSGTTRNGRTELDVLLAFLRPGDALVVTRVDRLARNIKDLQDIALDLNNRGVALKAIEQQIDTSSAAGKAFFDMLGVFAEFETNLRKERQREGILAAKAKGVYRGRKKSVDTGKIKELRDKGIGASEIAKQLGVSRTTVYRVLAELNGQQP